jgi:hypothetical protein
MTQLELNRRWIVRATLAAALVLSLAVVSAVAVGSQDTWRPAGAVPLSDAAAAARVTPAPETRPSNSRANQYEPSAAQLADFRNAVYGAGPNAGRRLDAVNPLVRHVTGGYQGTTDEIIQWAAHKWGIPEDELRAIAVTESDWRHIAKSDRRDGVDADAYPLGSRIDSDSVFESVGVMQIKWRPNESINPGTDPLRRRSTAFQVDYAAANLRYYFDGHCTWCGPAYAAAQSWLSVGARYSPSPWGNAEQLAYIARVKGHLAARTWEQEDFPDRPTWRPVGSPPLRDIDAEEMVVPRVETRPVNAVANNYVPTAAELAAFRNARFGAGSNAGVRLVEVNPHVKHVTGGFTGTTDEIIQWAAIKWGIPEDIMRAMAVRESNWRQAAEGDRRDGVDASRYPAQSRIDSDSVYESLGITQIKWRPDGSLNPGTEPLRWKSTAFNLDFAGAGLRYYFDGLATWAGPGYGPQQPWPSVGAHYDPSPWRNAGMMSYAEGVLEVMLARVWDEPGF